jgi:probable phosphoglycerate mutase
LVRHGESTWNGTGRFHGDLDVPLTNLGEAQARKLAERIGRIGTTFDGLYSSDLQRAINTAKPVAEVLGLPIQTDPRLREVSAGKLIGLNWDEATQQFPEYTSAVTQDAWNARRPGGESIADVACRSVRFLSELPSGRFMVVCHYLVIKPILGLLLSNIEGGWQALHIANTSITRIRLYEIEPTLPKLVGDVLCVSDGGHLE